MLWLAAAHIASGLLFRSVNRHGRVGGQLDQGSVSAIFKAMAKRARLSPGEVAQISAHSHPESARVRIWCGYGADIARRDGWLFPIMAADPRMPAATDPKPTLQESARVPPRLGGSANRSAKVTPGFASGLLQNTLEGFQPRPRLHQNRQR